MEMVSAVERGLMVVTVSVAEGELQALEGRETLPMEGIAASGRIERPKSPISVRLQKYIAR